MLISAVSVPYQLRVSSVSVPCQFRISAIRVVSDTETSSHVFYIEPFTHITAYWTGGTDTELTCHWYGTDTSLIRNWHVTDTSLISVNLPLCGQKQDEAAWFSETLVLTYTCTRGRNAKEQHRQKIIQLDMPLYRRSALWTINRLRPKLVWMKFKNSVRTSKKTQHYTITKINWLMLFKEIIPSTPRIMKPISTKWSVIEC
jgi:hypothetical protein